MECDESFSMIHELVDGELDLAAEQAVRQHLAGCPRCLGRHSELSRLKALLRRKFQRPELPAALAESMIERYRRPARPRRIPGLRVAAAVLLLGAVIAVGLLVSVPRPQLGHADASIACAEAFRRALAARRPVASDRAAWKEAILREIREGAGIALDRLPEIPEAAYAGWERETVKGVAGIRIDFVPRVKEPPPPAGGGPETKPGPEPGPEPQPTGAACARSLISMFFFPLENMRFDDGYLEELEEGHPCTQCIAMEDGSILCFRSAEFLISVVSNLGEDDLLARHRPR